MPPLQLIYDRTTATRRLPALFRQPIVDPVPGSSSLNTRCCDFSPYIHHCLEIRPLMRVRTRKIDSTCSFHFVEYSSERDVLFYLKFLISAVLAWLILSFANMLYQMFISKMARDCLFYFSLLVCATSSLHLRNFVSLHPREKEFVPLTLLYVFNCYSQVQLHRLKFSASKDTSNYLAYVFPHTRQVGDRAATRYNRCVIPVKTRSTSRIPDVLPFPSVPP